MQGMGGAAGANADSAVPPHLRARTGVGGDLAPATARARLETDSSSGGPRLAKAIPRTGLGALESPGFDAAQVCVCVCMCVWR